MPSKHPNTNRVGGPGASHEDATRPDKKPKHADNGGDRSNVSGGGGEPDAHHTHDPALKGKGRRDK